MDLFEEAKLKIKQSTDIVELIQNYVPLTRTGASYKALCPFHAEKTPSFTVRPETQHFKCFGCGKGGDVFQFVMEREGLSFREAMEQLAEAAGVSLDGVFGRGEVRRGPKVDVVGVLDQVRDYFGAYLRGPRGEAARDYLAARGLTAGIDDFEIGLHPSTPGEFGRFVSERKLPHDVLVQAGLFGRDGRREPQLGRLIFPIADDRGRVVGFGGRVLPADDPEGVRPKYINSPESPFFNKRRVLYGLRQVKNCGTRRIVVVEGYTDVIACHLAGFTGVVATLGTALTIEHARLLERYATEGVVLLFDGDRAGRQAADRAFRELVHTPLSVRMALLPEGADPADLCHDGGAGLREILDGADDALTVWFRLLRKTFDLTNDADVQRAAAECTRILASVENAARRQSLQRNMARYLGLEANALQPARLAPRAPAAGATAAPSHPPRRPTRPSKAEELDLDLIACLCLQPALLDHAAFEEIVGAGQFALARIEEVFGWIDAARIAGHSTAQTVVDFLFTRGAGDERLHFFLTEVLERALRIRDPESIFLRLHHGRRSHLVDDEIRRTRVLLQQAEADGDRQLVDQLTEHYMAVLRQARKLPTPRQSSAD